MAKLSEKHLRKEKVEKLKTKILGEIQKCKSELEDYLLSYHEDRSELTDQLFEDYITEIYSLIQLEKFINLPSTFLRVACVYEENDYIAYYVDDQDLDVWLQEDFNFVDNFMIKLGHPYKLDVLINILHERYFAYNFTNIFDLMLYDKKVGERLKDECNRNV